jgi:soluble lytic murein transglycosylase-like protein
LEMRSEFLIRAAGLAAIVAALAPAAHAAELVTLRNGFEMRCDHHAQVEGHVRLYLGSGEDNYIEFVPQEVAGVKQVPDPPTQAAATKDSLPALQSAGAETALRPADLSEMLSRAGHEHNLDVDLLASVVKAESAGNARAVSPAGARGLMQLMPSTASELGVEDSFKPEENVRGGSAYLDSLLMRYRDNLALALAAYNAGPQAVDKYRGIPPYHETQAYVARVIHEFNRRVRARETQARHASAKQAAVQYQASR